jgi:DNA-binding MarR family transcriptional regulator
VKTTLTKTRKAGANADAADRLRTAVARLSRSLRLTHVDGNLTPGQREVLFTITREGPMRLSDLASNEGLNPTTLSRIVSRLEAARLVTRSSDSADARVVHVESTDAGRVLVQEMRNERTDALLFALERLSKEEREELIGALPALELLVETLRSGE